VSKGRWRKEATLLLFSNVSPSAWPRLTRVSCCCGGPAGRQLEPKLQADQCLRMSA